MSEARQKSDWAHTSNLLALLANIHRGKGQRPFKAADFDPYGGGGKKAKTGTIDVHGLKAILLDGRLPEGLRQGR